MKVKVLKGFKDKHSGERYKVDDVIEITKKRFAEIQKVDNLVEEIKADKGTENTAE